MTFTYKNSFSIISSSNTMLLLAHHFKLFLKVQEKKIKIIEYLSEIKFSLFETIDLRFEKK